MGVAKADIPATARASFRVNCRLRRMLLDMICIDFISAITASGSQSIRLHSIHSINFSAIGGIVDERAFRKLALGSAGATLP